MKRLYATATNVAAAAVRLGMDANVERKRNEDGSRYSWIDNACSADGTLELRGHHIYYADGEVTYSWNIQVSQHADSFSSPTAYIHIEGNMAEGGEIRTSVSHSVSGATAVQIGDHIRFLRCVQDVVEVFENELR